MTIYIAEEDRDTRYALWYVPYLCKIPQVQMRSIDDIRFNGTYISGNPAFDHATNWERIHVRLPIVKIVEHWVNGANVFIVDIDKHARPIYDAVEAHLNAWGEYLDTSYNTKPVPEEDLIALDEFAQLMWSHAKWVDVKKYYNGIIKPKAAVPSRGALAAFWDNLDKKREAQAEQEKDKVDFSTQSLRFSNGVEYVRDTNRMLEQLKKHMDQNHIGSNAVDIYSRRESFVARMKESGHFRNFHKKS